MAEPIVHLRFTTIFDDTTFHRLGRLLFENPDTEEGQSQDSHREVEVDANAA